MLRINPAHVKKPRVLLFSLLMFAASGTANAGEPLGKNWHQDWDSACQESQAQGRPILLFVTMEHCYYCEKMCRETYGDNQTLQHIEHDFVLASIEAKHYPNLVRKLNVRLFPTTVLVGPDETVIDSMRGYVGPGELLLWLQAAAGESLLVARP